MKPEAHCRIVVLAGDGLSTRIVVNALRKRFGEVTVLIEEGESTSTFLRRRLRKLGWLQTAGQVAFMLYARVGMWRARRRRSVLLEAFDTQGIPGTQIRKLQSVNSAQARGLLRKLAPTVVVVNGTRIISAKTLASVRAPFINMHAGITPGFRGAHGGYWALATGAVRDCGVTVHRVDAGVDTGAVLAQARISPARSDNFFTYPLLQLGAGLPLLLDAVADACAGMLREVPTSGTSASAQWYHPALWTYVRIGLHRGVW